MNKDGQFKSKLLGGFNRKDVLQYIEMLQKKYLEDTAELERYIDELNRDKDQLANEVYEKDDLIRNMQQLLSQNNNELQSSQSNVHALQDELSRYQTVFRQREHDLKMAKEKNKQLSLQLEEHTLKSKRYDEINEKIGETMTEAQRQAELIVGNAHTEARHIMKQAKKAMTDISSRSFYFKEEITNLRKQIDRFSIDISEYIDSLDREITNTIQSLNYNDKDKTDNIALHAKQETDNQRQHIEKIRKTEQIVTHKLRTMEDNKSVETETDDMSFNNDFGLNDNDNNFFRFAVE